VPPSSAQSVGALEDLGFVRGDQQIGAILGAAFREFVAAAGWRACHHGDYFRVSDECVMSPIHEGRPDLSEASIRPEQD
jgi:hypothetical protein